MMIFRFPRPNQLVCAVLLAATASPALANGMLESRPWQFDTSADKANKAAVLDMIERKKGGYYDGFTTNITNTTNIGTQLNCNNLADATGNEAQNGQSANSPDIDNNSGIDSEANGNVAENSDGGGLGGGIDNEQSNSGEVASGVNGSSSSSSSGSVSTGNSDQVLNNTQDNSGNQHASVEGSTACDLSSGVIKGNVSVPGGILN